MKFSGFRFFLGLLSLFVLSQAHAGISLSATRVVFDAKHKEENITVRNEGGNSILLQSWLDAGRGDDTVVPFAVTPPLTKVAGKGQQLLRILYKGSGLPEDRESVVWLNVQEVPAAATKENTLQIAIRQRIKVFYRPAGLVGEVKAAPASLLWTLDSGGKRLSVSNPSEYHVSMVQMKLESGGKETMVKERFMLPPGARESFPLEHAVQASGTSLSFRSINDWGGQETFRAPLVSTGSVQAAHITTK